MKEEDQSDWTSVVTVQGRELILIDPPSDGCADCLIMLNGELKISGTHRVLPDGRIALKVRFGEIQPGTFRCLGFVGAMMAEYAACLELRAMPDDDHPVTALAIINPELPYAGE